MSSNTIVTVTVAQLDSLADGPLKDTLFAVHDCAAAIAADLALRGSSAILALLPYISEITVSDGGTITLTAAQALTGGVDDDPHSALALTHCGAFAITGATVAQLGQISRLPVIPDHVEVADGAAAVLEHYEALRGLHGRVRLTLTDSWLEAAQLPPLASAGAMLANGVAVRDSGIAIATLVDSEDAASIGYMNVYGAVLRADSILSVADVAALSRLTGFRKDGHTLSVWDSAPHLTASDAAEALGSGLVDRVFLRTSGGAVTLSAAGAVSLFTIPGFSATNPDGSAIQVTVADSAAEIDAVRRQLATLGTEIGWIVVSSSGTIGEAALRHLQALGATAAVGVMLTVRDSAASIAANFVSPQQGLQPAVWRLSSSAIVSVPEALALARQPQFSPAPYTLTLGSDAVVSAAEARTLASLAGGFSTAGHKVTLRDTAANLVAAAKTGAWDIVTTLTLAGSETIGAAAAETLLGAPKFVLTSELTIADSAANLLRPSLRRLIDRSPYATDIQTQLAGPETLDAETGAALVSLPHFADLVHDARIAPAVPHAFPELPSVILGHPGAAWVESTLTRAGAAPTDDTARRAIAAVTAHIADADGGGPLGTENFLHNLSEMAGAAPTREHIVAEALARGRVADGGDITAALDGALVNVYGESGLLMSATVERQAGFVVAAPDAGGGRAFSVTESIDGRESAPVVVLDAGTLQSVVSAAHAQFAADGAIQVQDGQYIDLYTAGSVPLLDRPALVYDPSAHTVALDIPGQVPVPLIVLGASAPPATLDVSEILVRQAS